MVMAMVYEYRCEQCGNVMLAKRTVENRDDCPLCAVCNHPTKRVFPPRALIVVPRAYQLECAREAAKCVLPSTPAEKRYWDTFGLEE